MVLALPVGKESYRLYVCICLQNSQFNRKLSLNIMFQMRALNRQWQFILHFYSALQRAKDEKTNLLDWWKSIFLAFMLPRWTNGELPRYFERVWDMERERERERERASGSVERQDLSRPVAITIFFDIGQTMFRDHGDVFLSERKHQHSKARMTVKNCAILFSKLLKMVGDCRAQR